MDNIKLFLFNSLSVTFGLFLFTFLIYVLYKIFYREDEINNDIINIQSENTENLFDDLESVDFNDEVDVFDGKVPPNDQLPDEPLSNDKLGENDEIIDV